MRFCCGVTLFYPTENELESIVKYKGVFERVYIFDNTEGVDCKKVENYFTGKNGFTYLSNQQNDGLSVAFNVMCQRAIEEGFDYICLFDQDSFISDKDLSKMINFIGSDKSSKVGIYVPEIVYNHLDESKAFPDTNVNFIEVDWAISSGSFINLYIYRKTQGFDENYFIDRLDFDYCNTIRILGFNIIRFKNAILYQSLGEKKRVLFSNVSQHNALRHYYIFRNRMYFYLKKNNFSLYRVLKLSLMSINHLLKILVLEDQKKNKISMVVVGSKDFFYGKMGKYSKK
ncbi:glycosyltransferase [Solibacillus sp. FSL W7-1464]|uniref:glycosyltransferase n=1 Tax=Solibacillus sp. FSL W7-1464 TaxID=2921706 RepID=UPI0030F4E4FC